MARGVWRICVLHSAGHMLFRCLRQGSGSAWLIGWTPQLHGSIADHHHPMLCVGCMPQAVLRYVTDEGIVSRLTQRWAAGGHGIMPAGSSSRRSSSAATAAGDSSSLSVRRWDELVQEVTEEVRVCCCCCRCCCSIM